MKIRTFHIIALIYCLLLFPFLGCQAFLAGMAKGTNAALGGMVEAERIKQGYYYSTRTKLMLFGGRNNEQYLGCLNCSKYDTNSITNEYGQYGSSYTTNSIWNNYGTYGSKYSQYSWRNPYATNPPVIVNPDGNFYGYFTVNKYFLNRTRINWIMEILDMADDE